MIVWRRSTLPDMYNVSTPPRKRPLTADPTACVMGYDTETRDGYARLLGRSDGKVIWPRSSEDCVQFLTLASEDDHAFFWNLRYDAAAMFKWLPESELLKLSDGEEVEIAGYRAMLTPRFLRLRRGNVSWVFTDLFLVYRTSLGRAAELHLGDTKFDYPVADIPDRAFALRDPLLQRYCVQDASLCQRLGERIVRAAIAEGVPVPRRIYSPASFAESVLVHEGLVGGTDNTPRHVQRAAYFAYAGNYAMTVRRGYFPNAEVWDINSSYPCALAQVPTNPAKWRRVGPEYRWRSGDLAIVQAEVRVEGLSTIKVVGIGGGSVIGFYPEGEFATFLLGEELPSVYRVQRGWVADHPGDTPYAALVNRLYTLRRAATEPAVADLYKLILNSLYGKLVQINRSPIKLTAGYCFNPLAAAQVTCLAREKLYKAASDVGDRLIFVATDALAVSGSAGLQSGEGLGEWKQEHRGAVLSIRSGLYELIKSDGNIKSRTRGFRGIKSSWVETLSGAHTAKISIADTQVITLKEGLLRKDYVQDDINKFVERVKVVDLNGDCTRLWPTLRTGKSLVNRQYVSEPLILPHALTALKPWHPIPRLWAERAGGGT